MTVVQLVCVSMSMGCHSVSHRLFHEKNIVFLPSLLICMKQNEPGWGEDRCREKVHLTGSREMPLANYGWLHDFSWVSPTKHFALWKLWITLSSDFLFLRKGDRHSLGTEGAAKVQHQSEESCEVRCETGPGSWALGLWSVGWEEKQRWREGGKHTRKRMGLRRAWERRIRWPVSDQKMSLCLCWEYLPHNTDRFVFPLKMQNLANKVSLSVACQWTSRVTNDGWSSDFRSSLRPFSGFGLFTHMCKDPYFFVEVPDPITAFYTFSMWLYCHCDRIVETKSRSNWARKLLLSCRWRGTPSLSAFTLRPGKWHWD